VQLIITRLPTMLGLNASGSLWQHLVQIAQHFSSINGMALTISVLVVGVIIITLKTRIPGELIGLVLATSFAIIFHVSDYGVKLVGALPAGLPDLLHLNFSLGQIVTLLPAALSIAIVILAQSSSLIRSSANEHDDKVRLNQDLFALGLANAASALTRGFAVNGSPPRTLAADIAGGRTQLMNILMGVFIGLLLLFGGDLFRWMPEAALAAIVFMLGWRLIQFRELSYILETHRTEFFVAMIALGGSGAPSTTRSPRSKLLGAHQKAPCRPVRSSRQKIRCGVFPRYN
jgi:MFS superfamily sulfate permease-like transporter